MESAQSLYQEKIQRHMQLSEIYLELLSILKYACLPKSFIIQIREIYYVFDFMQRY